MQFISCDFIPARYRRCCTGHGETVASKQFTYKYPGRRELSIEKHSHNAAENYTTRSYEGEIQQMYFSYISLRTAVNSC